jgi:hypothetical protein
MMRKRAPSVIVKTCTGFSGATVSTRIAMPGATKLDIKNHLIELLDNPETQVTTAPYRPSKPEPLKLPKNASVFGTSSSINLDQIEPSVTQHLLESVWTKRFNFHASWLSQKIVQARPIAWGSTHKNNLDAHGSFECHASEQDSALVLIYTNAINQAASLPLAFAHGQVTMRVVVLLGAKPALLSVSVQSVGPQDLHFAAVPPSAQIRTAIELRLKTYRTDKTGQQILSIVANHANLKDSAKINTNAKPAAQNYEWTTRSIAPYFIQQSTATDPDKRVLAIISMREVGVTDAGLTNTGPTNAGPTNTVIQTAVLAAANSSTKILRSMKYVPSEKLQRTVAKTKPSVASNLALTAKHFYVDQGGYGAAEFPNLKINQPIDLIKEQPLPVFSSAMAAVNLWNHGDAFFARLKEAGFNAPDYFKFAQLPLVLSVRAPIVPGPGHAGQTINAQALMVKPRPVLDKSELIVSDARPNIEVRFAHANLSIRRSSATSGRPDYLSTAIDSRWAWHEFGHVLLGAATHHMELPFCHGICDALVAIEHDQGPSRYANEGARGVTFPWLPTGRRHDRTVAQGWSWLGPMHQCSVYTKRDFAMSPKGYKTEQIMSTTLFNLYLAVGGNNQNSGQREPAKASVLGLIFHTLALAGSAELVPIRTPKQFLALVLDADQLRNKGKNHRKIIDSFAAQGLA